MKEEILPATDADYFLVCGEMPKFTMRLFKVVDEGRLLGIFGYHYMDERAVIFSNVHAKMPAKKLFRIAIACMKKISQHGIPLIALASECTAPRFLEHLGFKYVASNTQGDIYEWPLQYRS